MTRPLTPLQLLLILAVGGAGIGLRLTGLGHRQPTVDELHYRDDMSNTLVFLKSGHFRDHSVRHRRGHVPHGLLAPAFSYLVGKTVYFSLPVRRNDPYEQDNAFARLGYALTSVALAGVLFWFALGLFSPANAVGVFALAAFSPLLVNWGRSEYLDTTMTFFLMASFMALWRVLKHKTSSFGFSLLCGAMAGLSLASKWSALVILPFIPLAYCLVRWKERGGLKARTEDFIFLAGFGVGCAAGALPFLSLDSFPWAIWPVPNDPYGDKKMPLVERLMAGFSQSGHWSTLKGIFLYWGGPLFLPLVVLASWQALKTRGPEAIFFGVMFLASIPLSLVQEGDWFTWRATYHVAAAILLVAWALNQRPRRGAILIALTVLGMLPVTLRDGLRLRPSMVPYHGSAFTYSLPLPPLDPDHRIFK